MKKTMEKIVAALLVVIMLAANLPTNCVYASNEVENDVVITETEENTGGTLNYAYVESPYLETPNTQNIVVSWGDGTEEISDIRIIVSSEDGASEEWECIQSKDDSYLFSKEYTDSTEQATYQVTSFKYAQDGEQHEISMLDLNAKVEFGVNKAYEDYREYITPLDIETEGIEMSVVTIDENGQAKAQESIQAALEEVTAVNAYSAEVRNSEIVVALDPGHDDRHGGATHNGLVEQDLTLKIANYAKAELETYQGVQVYMTRTTSACPYPETDSSGKCIEQRVIAAAKVGAKIYVSIHLNATEKDTTPSGAEVIYPNSNWKSQVGADGKALAQSILDELVKLGLKDRGIYCKDSTINEKYKDGSASDYFSVQIYGKEQGIPGIIVEHAFMTNMSDVNNFLRTEEGLKSLGVADATGIAKFLGLSRETTLSLDTRQYNGTAGDIYQFLAITNNRKETPTVTSSDPTVVSVTMNNANDSRGFLYEIQGLKPGNAEIMVEHDGKSATFPVTYQEVDYTLDTKDMEYPVNKIYQFLAKITDKTKGQPTVSSSDTSVAEVYLKNAEDSRGYLYEIKTRKPGTSDIIMNYWGTERSFKIVVKKSETTLCLDTTQYNGTAGEIYQFLAITNNRKEIPTVVSSDSTVVSVMMKNANDSRGFLYEIQGLKPGSAEITVEHDGEVVTLPVAYQEVNYSLDTKDMEYPEESIYQFLAKITDKTKGQPTVSSSDTSVAEVYLKNARDFRGYLYEIKTKKAGMADIKVSYWGTERSFKIVVKKPETTLRLDTRQYNGTAGDIYQFLAITNNREETPTVTSSDSTVVSVIMKNANDNRGFLYEIQGLKPGNAEIMVEHDGKTAIFPVTYQEVNYTLDTKDMEYPEGSIYQFLAKITDKTKGQPTVSSSDTSVAAVYLKNAGDSRGYLYEVKTKKLGTAIITVHYFGTERSFILTVTEVEKYEIAGETTVKIQQMVDLFNSRNVSYPSEALSKGGARDITEFCQILCQEAASEGIRAEVVFAQSMLETGYLQFQGVVDAEQFNFAGLGATGGGEKGADFSSYGEDGVRMGLRAQIQHLKCYANEEPLNNECVDPRWQNWLRGMAPYVEWLGKQENPNEIGWATGENYGYNIKKIIYQVKEF